MSDFSIPEPKVSPHPAADVTLVQSEAGIVQKEAYPVRPRKNDPNDFMIPTKESDLRRIHSLARSNS